MQFPILYKLAESGSLQTWKISVEGATITTRFGLEGGAIQETSDTIKEGKNLGKKNETTPEQQAISEAESKWDKQQKKKGYVTDRAKALAGETDKKGEECMLAKTYGVMENGTFVGEDFKKIKFPAAAQPKLDGHRCRTRNDGTQWSRGQEAIVVPVPHILAHLQVQFQNQGTVPPFDGELYNHDLKDNFEKLSSILRQKKTPHEEHRLAQYHIYDIEEAGLTFSERYELLKQLVPADHPYLKLVETRIVNSHEELVALYDEWTLQGYEGLIVRNLDSMYEGKRSFGCQKLKGFRDAEFKIVGVKDGKGKLQGHAATFTCVTADGKEFEAKMEGETAKLKEYWDNHSLWQGKTLTVRFFSWTRRGVPRNGTGIRFREDL